MSGEKALADPIPSADRVTLDRAQEIADLFVRAHRLGFGLVVTPELAAQIIPLLEQVGLQKEPRRG